MNKQLRLKWLHKLEIYVFKFYVDCFTEVDISKSNCFIPNEVSPTQTNTLSGNRDRISSSYSLLRSLVSSLLFPKCVTSKHASIKMERQLPASGSIVSAYTNMKKIPVWKFVSKTLHCIKAGSMALFEMSTFQRILNRLKSRKQHRYTEMTFGIIPEAKSDRFSLKN